ncbi:GDSL esterase/lipase At3g27950-like [Prosopis cineraria]|uniref:GDSL esterase/lipase At3g27950-like n=1 Tax=Prosopis cineraria TaxID=364024 RepID=UPI0024106DC7|nr:GDSL esterase/lipase At3g27950-like [Prosopis cineraria]
MLVKESYPFLIGVPSFTCINPFGDPPFRRRKKTIMNSSKHIHVIGCLVLGLVSGVWGGNYGSETCWFPAIYNFGDSNSDTGAGSAAFTAVHPPNGESFFGSLSGRACDGRLILDFLTEELKLPYLSAYLNSLGSNYRHGANFAVGGSSIRPGGYSPFDLGLQISQFKQFKYRTNVLYNQLSGNRTELFQSSLPRPDEFSKALYTFDIGQNDLSYGFQHTSEEQVRSSIPNILEIFNQAVQQLYNEGARIFWIHNTGPIGCLPYSYIYYKSKQGNLDANGCVKPHNEIAQEYNRQLKEQVLVLKRNLPLAKFTYIDVYSAKYQLISDAKKQGFVSPLLFCCGSYYGYHVNCGTQVTVNGTVYGNPCKNPSQHVSWDGIHYSQAANLWVSKRILSGSFSDPPVPIQKACF